MKAQDMIPYGRQTISEEDIAAVVEVLRSLWLTQGPSVDRFEQAVADYCGAKYGVSTNSGTSALHIACRALDLARAIISGRRRILLSPRQTVLFTAVLPWILSTSTLTPAT